MWVHVVGGKKQKGGNCSILYDIHSMYFYFIYDVI